ncbi:MAG: SUMF1/EgtB/PvdO family nonheme iron enzyme [Tannerellaceae bacterium]|jgi:formylglycine-generating enzyme required for sulfatase activity|nr:SUMF1/EgtB/PvdO family nonheme iron enzyme [Tannerellaceae bacterium]
MEKFFYYLTIPCLLLIAMQGCINDDRTLCNDPGAEPEQHPIRFASHNLNRPQTRTSFDGNEWITGDLIGIYMLDHANPDIASNLAPNKRYIGTLQAGAAHTADFTPHSLDQAIYYPSAQGVSYLDFIAYYPWKPSGTAPNEIDNYLYPVDVSDQSLPSEIDMLYSNDVKRHLVNSNAVVDLGFGHMLSKVILNVGKKASSNIVIHPGMSGSLHDMATKTKINLGDTSQRIAPYDQTVIHLLGVGKDQDPKHHRPQGFDTTFQAIIIPHAAHGDRVQLIGGEGRQFTWAIPAVTFDRGKVYTYNLTLIDENSIEFTGTIAEWVDMTSQNDNVGHDQSGTMAKHVFPNSADSINVVYIRAGEFMMGNPAEGNATLHKTSISNGFRISEAEITNAQYARFLNILNVQPAGYQLPYTVTGDISSILNDPSLTAVPIFQSNTNNIAWDPSAVKWIPIAGKEHNPVHSVSWYGAKAYAIWAGGDLPTEAQWEYAARSTTPASYYYQDGGATGAWAWFASSVPSPVKLLAPNAWKLYDMFGNVEEWTRDAVTPNSDYPNLGAYQIDPCYNVPSGIHPLRGGSYQTLLGTDLRISARNVNATNTSDAVIPEAGFRVAFR